MAVHTYRFRLTKPTIDESLLAAEVGTPVTIVNAGGTVVDAQADDAFADDLKEAMFDRGFAFVELDPATTARNEFGTSTANPFIDNVINSVVTVPDGTALLLSDIVLGVAGSIDVVGNLEIL